jgi:hypothetical protein
VRGLRLHPETKFENADFTNVRTTRRRDIAPLVQTFIGKEANELEVQDYLGAQTHRAVIYGASPHMLKRLRSLATWKIRTRGVRVIARSAGLSPACCRWPFVACAY